MNRPSDPRRRGAYALPLLLPFGVLALGCGGVEDGPIDLPPGSAPATKPAATAPPINPKAAAERAVEPPEGPANRSAGRR